MGIWVELAIANRKCSAGDRHSLTAEILAILKVLGQAASTAQQSSALNLPSKGISGLQGIRERYPTRFRHTPMQNSNLPTIRSSRTLSNH